MHGAVMPSDVVWRQTVDFCRPDQTLLHLIAIIELDELLQRCCVNGVWQLSRAAIAQAISLPWGAALANGHRGQPKGLVHEGEAHMGGRYCHSCEVQVQLLAVLNGQQNRQVMTPKRRVPAESAVGRHKVDRWL